MNKSDYENMSDFEINVLVAKASGLLVKESFDTGLLGFTERYHRKYPNTIWAAKHKNGEQIDAWEQINFFAHPEEMMPLVFAHGISMKSGYECDDDGVDVMTHCAYTGSDFRSEQHGHHRVWDDNPIYAYAIVYLLMMESNNE